MKPVPGGFATSRPGVGLNCELDHLVLAARTLDEGVAWCEETLGITPGPGGRHALMGTHNRVFAIGSEVFPRAYFEIIAIDPDALPGRAQGATFPLGVRRAAPCGPRQASPGRRRWFDLDDAGLQAVLARGPRLVHWVARTAELDAAVAALTAQGIDVGRVLQASRPTPQGELRWRIAVRDDGQRLFGGALPMLIEWGAVHPADALPESGVTLASLTLCARDPAVLRRALQALGLATTPEGGAAICATLNTPRGTVTLCSPP